MESRNVTLTLEKAKEFYNSGNGALKEIALQAFTKEELTTLEWKDIKTFEDACKALNLNIGLIKSNIDCLLNIGHSNHHLVAVYKMDIIRKALNKGWEPSLVEGKVYCPHIRFYPTGSQKTIEATLRDDLKIGGIFKSDGQRYTLVGGSYRFYVGLGCFGCGFGDVMPTLGLLGCKSREIAKHMSRYFSKEIFEATYAHHIGTYRWE